jgi:RNase H-like domain found in reverse transcriptase
VIAYARRATHGAEPNYGATQLECVAVVWAVQHFRYYLIGRRFTLITDHSALKWLWNKPNLTGMYARWLVILQEYEFDTVYKKGKNHQNVDTLSRLPQFIRKGHPAPHTIYTNTQHE